ncbi:DNA polymerase subunit Cdc27 [Chaetomium fimeti]|uniref:DNA polymerase delta subunit 3 n=1 Tax=Chaetomium fimeti TaxID=1854472 RepID=A0AAE0HEA4_9PEZI|nr:DNA polymerase subunit Cdc27 [Chaetomium fimeti]
MESYNKFLAENVLTEDKVITYRFLSRTLQVHVNTAKQMLYEFHRSQNAKRPGAVHATYLVYGTKKATSAPSESQNGTDGDIEMTSSAPEVESLADVVPASTLCLVSEEQLKDNLADYEEVTSIHVYSIAPHPTKDMALLVDAANQVLSLNASDEGKNLASITNPRVRRRERQGVALKAAAASAAAAVKPQAKPAFSNVKEESKPTQPVQETVAKALSSGLTKKPASSLKRGGNSGIMQAFSKAATKPTKVNKEAEAATPSSEDSSLQPMSDDGEDDDEMSQPKPRAGPGFRTKRQREEELRQMMEEDDEEEEAQEKEETPEEEPMEEEEPPAPEPVKEEEAEVVTTSANGRRRGKRRIMRKKQIMDDQGYLVTIQEPGWESFSEDEAPPPTKPKTTSAAPPAQASKPKKAGPKGQGNIMSFFSKK